MITDERITSFINSFGPENPDWLDDLEKDPDWQKTAETDEQTYFDLEYVFAKYERIK